MPHPWQYDESVQVGTDYRDEKEVRAYDRYIQHIKEEFSTLDWMLEGMMTRGGLRIIEKGGQGFLWVYVCEK